MSRATVSGTAGMEHRSRSTGRLADCYYPLGDQDGDGDGDRDWWEQKEDKKEEKKRKFDNWWRKGSVKWRSNESENDHDSTITIRKNPKCSGHTAADIMLHFYPTSSPAIKFRLRNVPSSAVSRTVDTTQDREPIKWNVVALWISFDTQQLKTIEMSLYHRIQWSRDSIILFSDSEEQLLSSYDWHLQGIVKLKHIVDWSWRN